MYRLIEEKLRKWKDSELRKPLILRGARQIGKTYTLKHFAEQNYKTVHYIDFERNPQLQNIFKKDKNPIRIIRELELFLQIKINPQKDILIMDEIQIIPSALASLRYFYEEMPQLHLIAAGSLIEFALKEISFPVGRVEMLHMYPMNFLEFLYASQNQLLIEYFDKPIEQIPENYHNIMLDKVREYFFIGGMPEAVKIFKQRQNFLDVYHIQKNIIDTFINDFSKYAGRADKNCILEVLFSVAKNVGHQIQYSKLSGTYSNPTIKKAYQLLEQAKIITTVNAIDPSGTPLGATASSKKFKSLFLDMGLMNVICGLQYNSEMLTDNLLKRYKGAMAEQFVGQELVSTDQPLYYWARHAKNSAAEVDYVISAQNTIKPIEVKSGSAGKLKSMHLLLAKYTNISHGYVLSLAEYSELIEQKLKFVPMYFAQRILSTL
jgi:predicted AAA+ superfamily ATPase